ncbi:EamA family transporter [Arthrobacter tumbae]|uniref:DMT family transporter n=1 Tax=Arthrobacter tumbae TaxID=163874 RepID=UPI0027DC3E2D|nr:EamA family transporter [Arthrobacter tumbae]MBM7781122.1 DME family drug/metabolite transporter [Arthrobacter tumbae]
MTHQSGAGIGAVFVLIAAVLWGTTGTVASFAPGVGPLAIGAAAMGIGGLLQAALAGPALVHARHELRRRWIPIALGGLAVAIYPLAFYSSMRLAGVAVGTVISIGSAPIASAVIERVVDGHRLTRRWVVGAGVGLVGVVLLSFVEPAQEAGAGDTTAGVLLGLLAGVTYAMYSWAAHRTMRRGVRSRVAMGAIFGVGGVLLMPVLFLTGAPLLASWNNFAVGAYMALVPMFLGYVLFGLGLARVTASTATTLSLAEPVVAAMLAVVIVGERLPAAGWIGVGLVIASLAVLTVPVRRNVRTAVGVP